MCGLAAHSLVAEVKNSTPSPYNEQRTFRNCVLFLKKAKTVQKVRPPNGTIEALRTPRTHLKVHSRLAAGCVVKRVSLRRSVLTRTAARTAKYKARKINAPAAIAFTSSMST